MNPFKALDNAFTHTVTKRPRVKTTNNKADRKERRHKKLQRRSK